MITGNEPINARPYSHDERPSGGHEGDRVETFQASEGLTIRQHFAAMAMQGLCASGFFTDKNTQKQSKEMGIHVSEAIAVSAIDLADTLITELNKEK